MRTCTVAPSGQEWAASARCISTAADTASVARAQATKKASPWVSTSYPLQQAGGAFDIGEEQGDRSRRQFTHAAPLATGGTRHSRPSWTTGLSDGNQPPADRRRRYRRGQS